MRYGRPHSDRKDQNMVIVVTMCSGRPHGDKRPENGPYFHHVVWKTSR